MLDFQIEMMTKHMEGFYVASVKSLRTQDSITVHNRFGSWMQGDPEVKRGPLRDLRRDVAMALAHRLGQEKKKPTTPANPFMNVQTHVPSPPDNPFMALASAQQREGATDA